MIHANVGGAGVRRVRVECRRVAAGNGGPCPSRLSVRRGSVLKYLRAIGHVLWTLPRTLWTRRPCSAKAVRDHFELRGRGTWGDVDTMKTR